MTVTKDDFEKVWASQSPLTPYSFSDAQYKEGWNFVGATPPSRQMWDAFMQNADEKLKYLYQHEDVPLGHEYFTFNPNVPQGSLPLFGGEYDRATYSDLWNWVQEQTGYLKTEAEWQTLSASNNGNVPFYSDGDGSTTFRVPSLKCWVRGANGTVSEVGSYLEAGSPNIYGYFEIRRAGGDGRAVSVSSGAFDDKGFVGGNSYSLNMTSSDIPRQRIAIDASRSSSIYGNSTTVQPESIVGLWLVKAYGVIVDTGTIDEQAYIDDRFNASKQYTDDKIAEITTEETGTITILVGTAQSAYIRRIGRVAECGGYVTGLSGTGYITFANVSNDFKPTSRVDFVTIDNDHGIGVQAYLGTEGNMSVWSVSSSPVTTVRWHFMYFLG